jgi:hypothetical protein
MMSFLLACCGGQQTARSAKESYEIHVKNQGIEDLLVQLNDQGGEKWMFDHLSNIGLQPINLSLDKKEMSAKEVNEFITKNGFKVDKVDGTYFVYLPRNKLD